MGDKLFRQEAIDANRARLTGTVVAATPPRSRIYTAFVVLVVVAALAFLVLGKYATRAEVRGVLSDQSGVSTIAPPGPATVREIHVTEGQLVEAGTPLVTLSLSDGSDGESEGLTSQIADLDRQDQELEEQHTLAIQLGEAEVAALRQRRNSLSASISSLRTQQQLVERQIGIARDNASRAERLAERGAGTQQQVEEARSELLSRELEREGIRERIIDQSEAMRTLEADIAVRTINLQQAQSQLRLSRAALNEQRTDLVRRNELTLVAPKAGRIGDLNAQIGTRALPDSILLAIVPENSDLEVNLYAPTRAIGFVRPGQQVRLQFDAFPYQKYGTAQGEVTWVSDVPSIPEVVPDGAPVAEPMYRVRVALRAQEFNARSQALPLRPGMTLTANLILEERRLWEVFFEPVLRTLRS